MGEIFNEIVEKNRPELPVLSILQGEGTVLRDNSDRRISYDKASLNSYKVMNEGDFIIHLRSFEGGLECSKHHGISSPAYKVLRTTCLIPEAYKDYFRSYKFIHGKLSIAVTGIRDGKSIDMPSFWTIKIALPDICEQNKIASFLSLLNNRIEKQRQLVEAFKSYKRGLSTALLFNNESNWNKVKVGDFSPALGGYAFDSKSYNSTGKYFIITIGNVTGNRYVTNECNSIINLPFDLQEHQKLKIDDILISMTGNVGRVSLVSQDDCLLNQRVAKLEITDEHIKEYVFQILSTTRFESKMVNLGQGAAQKNIKCKNIEDFDFLLPQRESEIKMIGQSLKYFDNLIIKATSVLESVWLLKSNLLQQLFI